jgi:hypothetical protein
MPVTDTSPRVRNFPRLAAVATASVCLVVVGCDGRQSTEERVKQEYERTGKSPVTVYPFAGTITVDGQPPVASSQTAVLVVVAYDVSKPERRAAGNACAAARPDGSFEFHGGGLPPGKYAMLFAELEDSRRLHSRPAPDGLKNLYNDPEVNGKKSEFVIDHQAPGKKDYTFNLSVASADPPAAPGPKALTKIPRGLP